jgi:hypothetical protein
MLVSLLSLFLSPNYSRIISHIMNRSLIWIGLFIGSTVGGLLPQLWGASIFSLLAIILSFLGGLAGIWIGYKIGQSI